MSFRSKFKSFFALEDEYEEYEEFEETDEIEEVAPVRTQKQQKPNVVSLQSITKSAKMVLCEPRIYDEAQEIADHLKNRRSVIINLQRVQHDQAKRIVDFLSGTVYAIGGDIQLVGNSTFLAVPDHVDISGKISELIASDEEFSRKRW